VYVPELPPVYDTKVLTPLAGDPLVSVPVVVAPAQFNPVNAANGGVQSPVMVIHVNVPLQIPRTWPSTPGFSVIHPEPFQYIIWFSVDPF
jgi:hypothetical protein